MRIDREALFELRTSCTGSHPYKLFKHHSSISVRSNFFAERVKMHGMVCQPIA